MIGSVWILDSNILKILFFVVVLGVIWSDKCVNCILFKVEVFFLLVLNVDYNDERLIKKFFEYGYLIFCLYKSCFVLVIKYFKYEENIKIIDVLKKLFYSLYVMGVVVILFNLIVLIIIIFVRFFCKIIFMLLIFNMVLCDLLIGIYFIIIGNLNIFSFFFSV